MGESVLYCDKDSAIFIQNANDGDYLGHLTDALVEYGTQSFIEEFVLGGQIIYAFSVFCPSTGKRRTKCKVKGITLIYENSKVVNFATFRDMNLKTPPQCMYIIEKRSRENTVVPYPNPKHRSTRLFLRSAGLWTTLTLPYGFD